MLSDSESSSDFGVRRAETYPSWAVGAAMAGLGVYSAVGVRAVLKSAIQGKVLVVLPYLPLRFWSVGIWATGEYKYSTAVDRKLLYGASGNIQSDDIQ